MYRLLLGLCKFQQAKKVNESYSFFCDRTLEGKLNFHVMNRKNGKS